MTTAAAPAVTNQTTPSAPRLHGLDALRGGALLLGIVLHGLAPFLPGGGWLVADRYTTEAAAAGMYVIHLFRMALFMMLAGYFGRMVLQRRGPGRYLKDRALRIGLPVIVFWPLAVGSLGLIAVAAGTFSESPQTAAPTDTANPLNWIPPGQLWFLVVLLQCVLITVAVRAILVRVLGAERSGRIAGRIGSLLATPAGVLIAALPYAAGLLLQGPDRLTGIQEPVTLMPVPGASTAYLGAFLTGWFLHSRGDALARLGRGWPFQLIIAAGLTVLGWFAPDILPGPLTIAVIALAGWTWTFGLVGLCTRLMRREVPAVRYLADASYWMYLLHLPILLLIEWGLRDLNWPILIKLLVTWAVCAAVLLISYDLLVRATPIGRWLNGRKHPSLVVGGLRRLAGAESKATVVGGGG
ncbi:acyltransferase family protein [Microlunatus speluncae]|uniref:acyltransferase family protein n=1 Tax=Microlunatus speluncae TaxID=2594267 RepID=UPI0012662F14|nr:acyltransferase family protein [Microlunatus speluncae]